MGSGNINAQSFRGALIGYNKMEVDNYIDRIESELSIHESRQGKWEQQVKDLSDEAERLHNRVDAERAEKKELLNKNTRLNNRIEDLEKQVQIIREEKEILQKQLQEQQDKMNEEGINPKTIQDAILNAQRMGEIVISEANEKSQEIIRQADMYRLEQETTGRQLLEKAKKEADTMIQEAQRKCDNLQKDYDRILLDVTGFKAQLMKMYRKHMEILAALPEKEISEIDCTNEAEKIHMEQRTVTSIESNI